MNYTDTIINKTRQEQKEQKPEEWSEEDKNKLNHILEIVHIASGSEVSIDEKEELETFLKSLRPSWKPSEEQTLALRTAVIDCPDDKELLSLYEDLKKL